MANTFLPQNGSYRALRVYKITEIIYDYTYFFVQQYKEKSDRTVDQMVQAARSGKQNIAEGNQAAATSSETEIKLTNVAKASLEELLLDYEDHLRTHRLTQWDKSHPRYEPMRNYTQTPEFIEHYADLLSQLSEEELANLCITLIHQAMYMLHKLLEHQQERFVTQGGIREQMLHARLNYRDKKSE